MTSLRKLGSSDLEVFPLALGGNVFGWTADEAQSFAVLDAYTAVGGNFVDSADVYSAWVEGNQGGESETVLGKWLTSRGNRADVVVATKVSQHPEFRGLSAANIKAAADASLRRLGTNYIDLYYTHFDQPEVPVEEIIGALDEASVDSARAGGAAKHLETERGRRVLDALDEIAAAHDVPVATVALAWLAAQPTVAAPIASARTVEQLPALVGVGELRLTEAEVGRLTEASG
jgi:aryl-alcohol dehydrogenase-like predicted oxidoreductase